MHFLAANTEETRSDLVHVDHPAVIFTLVERTASLAETRDGALLNVSVHNRLPYVRRLDVAQGHVVIMH